jgi:hypothetical protein
MRKCINQRICAWDEQCGQGGAGAVYLTWRQDWFVNLCLAIILAALLFFMLLSIYLVFTKPPPTAIPEGTGTINAGSGYAGYTFQTDRSGNRPENTANDFGLNRKEV